MGKQFATSLDKAYKTEGPDDVDILGAGKCRLIYNLGLTTAAGKAHQSWAKSNKSFRVFRNS